MRIIHLANDEKFIDQAIRQFEEILPSQNQCIILSKVSSLRYVKTPGAIALSPLMASFGGTAKSLRGADLIILHSLTRALWRACRWASPKTPIVWLGFGFDYYDLINADEKDVLGPLTKDFLSAEKNPGPRGWLHAWRKRRWVKTKGERLDRITHFAPVLPIEYALVQRRHPDFSPALVPWSYLSADDALCGIESELAQDANDILIGNSATISNNHLESIEILCENRYAMNRRIFMPLSYGSQRYKEVVEARGREKFRERFFPLKDFIPAREYVEILSRCRTAILNHRRQQAVGNIIVLLQQGSSIFINEQSPLFDFLRSEGAFIFSIAELLSNPETINVRLTSEQVSRNRAVVAKHWGRLAVREKTQSLIATTLGSHPQPLEGRT